MDEDQSQDRIPKHPEKEGSLLAIPEAGDLVVNGENFGSVSVRIVIFKVVVPDDEKQHKADPKYRTGMNVECDPGIAGPGLFF